LYSEDEDSDTEKDTPKSLVANLLGRTKDVYWRYLSLIGKYGYGEVDTSFSVSSFNGKLFNYYFFLTTLRLSNKKPTSTYW